MSEQQNRLTAMLEQYESNTKPKYEKKTEKVYDLKNYFNTTLKDKELRAEKVIRILPTADGSSPFTEFRGHKVQVDGEWKTFACLKHEKGEACPFCEAREALMSTGKESDKELAKKYNAKLMYIVKIIDRDNEADGVKFWRFNHDYRKEGIYDKIVGLLRAVKKDVTDPATGRDLMLTINKNQTGIPVVSAVASLDPSVLSENPELVKSWTSDARTWEDVYSVRTYDYLEIIVKGGVPVWDKDKKAFVDKASVSKSESSDLDSELSVSLETVKANIKVAQSTNEEAVMTETSEDDLPF